MKKGMLFTVTTVFLLLGVFTLCSAFMLSQQAYSFNDLKYIVDDVGDDIYLDLMETDISVVSGEHVLINLDQVDITDNRDSLFTSYENFIEGTYASKNNLEIGLENFNSTFYLEPYGGRRVMDGGVFYFYTGNNLINISIDFFVDETLPDDNSGQPSQDPGGDLIKVRFIRDGIVLSNYDRLQDGDNENSEFYQTFRDDGPPVVHDVSGAYVQYGNYNGEDGVLRVWRNNLNANISMKMYYSLADVKIFGGNISINHTGNLTLNSNIMIFT